MIREIVSRRLLLEMQVLFDCLICSWDSISKREVSNLTDWELLVESALGISNEKSRLSCASMVWRDLLKERNGFDFGSDRTLWVFCNRGGLLLLIHDNWEDEKVGCSYIMYTAATCICSPVFNLLQFAWNMYIVCTRVNWICIITNIYSLCFQILDVSLLFTQF